MARGNGIADIRNYRWINLRKAPTMIWRFPSCAQCRAAEALNQILFRSQAQEDLVTLRLSDTAVLQPVALLCSRTVRCSLCAISLFFSSLFPNSTFALFHFLSSPHKIKCAANIDTSLLKRITGLERRILRGSRRRWKASWLPEHSVLDIQPSDCCSVLFTSPWRGVSSISGLAALSTQLNFAAAVGRDSHRRWDTGESLHWRHTLKSALHLFLSLSLPEELATATALQWRTLGACVCLRAGRFLFLCKETKNRLDSFYILVQLRAQQDGNDSEVLFKSIATTLKMSKSCFNVWCLMIYMFLFWETITKWHGSRVIPIVLRSITAARPEPEGLPACIWRIS